jgi:hypothetical protein
MYSDNVKRIGLGRDTIAGCVMSLPMLDMLVAEVVLSSEIELRKRRTRRQPTMREKSETLCFCADYTLNEDEGIVLLTLVAKCRKASLWTQRLVGRWN